MTDKFLYYKRDVKARYGLSSSTIVRYVGKGIIPKPRYLSGLAVWSSADIALADKNISDKLTDEYDGPLDNLPHLREA